MTENEIAPGSFGVRTGKRRLRVLRQQAIRVVYEAIRIDAGFYADLVVEDKVITDSKNDLSQSRQGRQDDAASMR